MDNKEKAKKLADLIHETLSTCGGNCKKCALQNICDDLDILYFKLMQVG